MGSIRSKINSNINLSEGDLKGHTHVTVKYDLQVDRHTIIAFLVSRSIRLRTHKEVEHAISFNLAQHIDDRVSRSSDSR